MSNRRMYYFGVSLLIGSFLFVVQAQAAELSVLGASTFLGGSNLMTPMGSDSTDSITSIAIDTVGNVIVAGYTGQNFPTLIGAYDTSHNGSGDAFIAKFNSSLSKLLAATYLGGSGMDAITAITLDGTGNIIVTGNTYSNNFPTTPGAFSGTLNGIEDGFVTKLSSNLSGPLLGSTYFGGTGHDLSTSVILDKTNNVYIAGSTEAGFPATVGSYDNTYNGDEDGFIIKFSSSLLGAPIVGTYLGGSYFDQVEKIKFGTDGNIYAVGRTMSKNFPTVIGAYDTVHNDNEDGFVAKLSPTLSNSFYSGTYVGGGGNDRIRDLAFGSDGSIFVVGDTSSSNFPTTAGAYDSVLNGAYDGFVTRLSSGLTGSLFASTYLGFTGNHEISSILLDSSGNLYLAGLAGNNFPTTVGAYDMTANGGGDSFIAKMSPTLTSLPLAATYLGGSQSDAITSMTYNSSGDIYVVGMTSSNNFPTTPGAYDLTLNATTDGFVAYFLAGFTPQPIGATLPLVTKKTQFKQGEMAPFSVSTKLPGTFNSRLVDLAQTKEITLNPIAVKTEGDNTTSILYSFANVPANTYVLRLSKLSGDTIAESAPLTISVVLSNPLPTVFLLSTQTPSVFQGQTITINVYPGNFINHKLENGAYQLQWINHNGQQLSISPLSTPSKSFSLFLPYTYSTASLSSGVYTVQLVDMSLPKKIVASKQVTIMAHDLPTSDPTRPTDSPTSIPRSIPRRPVQK